MSLINQALKKEQQRRSLNLRDTTSDIPTYDSGNIGNGLSPATRQGNRSLSLLIGFTGFGVVLLALGGGFVYFGKSYLSQLNSTPVVAQADPEPMSFASGPAEDAPAATVTDILDEMERANPPSVEEPIVEAAEPAAGDLAEDSAADPVATEVSDAEPADVNSQETETVEAATEPQYDFKIQDLIDEFQVLGYRSAGPNSRLLMNGRVYKIGDIVDNERGLRFVGSEGDDLVFEAPSGYQYRKPL